MYKKMNCNNWWKNLQPLRLPPRWHFTLNKLEAIEPDNLSDDNKAWLYHFVEDILYMETKNQHKENRMAKEQTIGIDLGWYPEGEPKGAYKLVAIIDNNWDEPILEFTSRHTYEIVETIEFWLFEYFSRGFIDEESFRKSHLNKK